MSLKKVDQVKKDKGFKFFDIIVYAVIVAFVAIAFIATFAGRNTDPLLGVRIKVYGEEVCVCNFEENRCTPLTDNGSVELGEKKNNIQLVTVRGNGGYNIVEVNFAKRTVRVIEADCKTHDCVHSSIKPTLIIKSNDSLPIYCNPHAVLIEPLNYVPNYDSPDIII